MPKVLEYNRNLATEYAIKYALVRNPSFYNFDNLGGDCTNFCSQCLLAGSNNIMNRDFSPLWYYNNINDRSPSWTDVEFLYEYLIQNKNKGPFAKLVEFNEVNVGDLVQLKFVGEKRFSHCAIITNLNSDIKSYADIFVCTHTIDSLNRPLSNYKFTDIRFLHVTGVYQ